MQRIKLLIVSLFLVSIGFGVNAQSDTNNETNFYKITFLDIDQFQLKEVVPALIDIFDTPPINKGEPDVLYIETNKNVTKEYLKTKLEAHSITYDFKLKIANDERN